MTPRSTAGASAPTTTIAALVVAAMLWALLATATPATAQTEPQAAPPANRAPQTDPVPASPPSPGSPGPAGVASPRPGVVLPVAPRVPDRGLNNVPPELASVEVDSVEHREVSGRFEATARALSLAETAQRDDTTHLRQQRQAVAIAEAELVAAHDAIEAASTDHRRTETLLGDIAVASYEASPHLPSVGSGEPGSATRNHRADMLTRAVQDTAAQEFAEAREVLTEATAAGRIAVRNHQQATEVLPTLEARIADRQPTIAALRAELDILQLGYTATRRIATVAGTDLPLLALAAYYRAAEAAPCAIDWHLLAGIGFVESRHGGYLTEGLDPSGVTIGLVLGKRLDGTDDVLEIADSDGGRLDGDLRYDRAVGPMQFIPTTWAIAQTDGNADGVINPHNIFDAAASAATYLCAASAYNGSAAGSLGAYNRSEVYAVAVLDKATTYAELPTAPRNRFAEPRDERAPEPEQVPDLSAAAATAAAAEADQAEDLSTENRPRPE